VGTNRLFTARPDTDHALGGEHVDKRTCASAVTGSVLEVALRVLAADRLGVTAGQDERRALLARTQRPDGSWPATASYRMGRFPVFFGSSCLTTVFALSALQPARPAPAVPPPRTGE
jgi:hypothetical protein